MGSRIYITQRVYTGFVAPDLYARWHPDPMCSAPIQNTPCILNIWMCHFYPLCNRKWACFCVLSMYTVLGVVAAMHCGIIDKLLLKLTNYCHTLHFADFQERENRMNVKGQQDHQTKEWCCFNRRHWHDVQI